MQLKLLSACGIGYEEGPLEGIEDLIVSLDGVGGLGSGEHLFLELSSPFLVGQGCEKRPHPCALVPLDQILMGREDVIVARLPEVNDSRERTEDGIVVLRIVVKEEILTPRGKGAPFRRS